MQALMKSLLGAVKQHCLQGGGEEVTEMHSSGFEVDQGNGQQKEIAGHRRCVGAINQDNGIIKKFGLIRIQGLHRALKKHDMKEEKQEHEELGSCFQSGFVSCFSRTALGSPTWVFIPSLWQQGGEAHWDDSEYEKPGSRVVGVGQNSRQL